MKAVGDYNIVEKVGNGQFGTVYRCKLKAKCHAKTKQRLRPNREIACKKFVQEELDAKLYEFISREVHIMKKINHSNILRYIDAFQTKKSIYIFFEFCNGGDLSEFIKQQGGRVSEKLTWNIALQVITGLAHLNENEILHRDLKPTNIMIHYPTYEKSNTVSQEFLSEFDYENGMFEVIIVDLGLARTIDGQGECLNTFCGSLLHMAPEMIDGYEYSSKVDIWAFGTVVYQMLTGFAPFHGRNVKQLVSNIKKGVYGIPKLLNLSPNMVRLLNMCLQADPDDRATHKEVLEFCTERIFEEKKCESETDFQCKIEYPKNAKEVNEENSYLLSIKDPKYYNSAITAMQYNNEESLLQSMNLDEEELSNLRSSITQSMVKNTDEDGALKLPTMVKTAFSNTEISDCMEMSVQDLTLMKNDTQNPS